MEVLKHNLPMIAGALGALLLLIIFLVIKKKKGKKKNNVSNDAHAQHEEHHHEEKHALKDIPYEENKPGIVELVSTEARNMFIVNVEVKENLRLRSIEPAINRYGAIHNYDKLVNRNYRAGNKIKIYFNKKKEVVDIEDLHFKLDFRYDDNEGGTFIQSYVYNKKHFQKLGALHRPQRIY